MATYKAVLYNYKKQDGTKRVTIRITVDRKKSYIPTEIYIKEKHWNSVKGEVRNNHDLHAKYNNTLRRKIFDLQGVEAEQMDEIKLTSKEIKEVNTTGPEDFISYFEKRLAILDKTRAKNTYDRNFYSLAKLKKYIKTNNLPFKAITVEWVENYYIYLLGINASSTANKEMETISRLISHAIKRGIIKNYIHPFSEFKKKKEVRNILRLPIEDINKFYFAPITGKWSLYRDMWLVQFYAVGMRISDAICIKVFDIMSGRLEYEMDKNEKKRSIPITGRLAEILYQYAQGKSSEEYLFTEPNIPLKNHIRSQTTQMNIIIKEVAEYCKISSAKKVKTHTARHSFANIARKKTKDLLALRDLMGHSDVKITQKYVDELDMGENDELTDMIYE